MIRSPRVIGSCAFETDPTIDSGVADSLRSSLVVTRVMRTLGLGMKSVVRGLAVWASAWVDG